MLPFKYWTWTFCCGSFFFDEITNDKSFLFSYNFRCFFSMHQFGDDDLTWICVLHGACAINAVSVFFLDFFYDHTCNVPFLYTISNMNTCNFHIVIVLGVSILNRIIWGLFYVLTKMILISIKNIIHCIIILKIESSVYSIWANRVSQS